MNDYLLLFHGGGPEDAGLSAEEMQQIMMKWSRWTTGLRDAGVFKGGEPLEREARTVSPDGSVKDGPFAESKELVGGYVMVAAASMDEATEHAKQCPILSTGGYVEVRPVMDITLPPIDGHVSPCPE
ncbi:MAG: YciI family protein [bacterium]|nr:YciI family protein [bacterium]